MSNPGGLRPDAVLRRRDPAAQRSRQTQPDQGSGTPWQGFRQVGLPLIAPVVAGIGMFGFTLS